MQIGEWVDADQYNGRIVRIANSFVFEGTGVQLLRRVSVRLGRDHGPGESMAATMPKRAACCSGWPRRWVGDYGRSAEAAWEPITRRYLVETASVRPMVTMVATADWIEFTLRYVVHYRARAHHQGPDLHPGAGGDRPDRRPGRAIAAATLNIEKVAPLDIRLRRASREG